MTEQPAHRPSRDVRVIIDNDFAGDPDGLVQLAHHLLSESVEVVGIIASDLPATDPSDASERTAESGRQKVLELLDVMGIDEDCRLFTGAEAALDSRISPQPSEAAWAIVGEAERTDREDPLFVVCGGGLTDVASALLLSPSIAERITIIWIGGYAEETLVPEGGFLEFNTRIDPIAVDVVFNATKVPLWQVPLSTYGRCVVSMSELRVRMRTQGNLGAYLYTEIQRFIASQGRPMGETFLLGDSPLVLLTSLTSNWTRTPISSDAEDKGALQVDDAGSYRLSDRPSRMIRVYRSLDTRLMLEDLYAKLQECAVENTTSGPRRNSSVPVPMETSR